MLDFIAGCEDLKNDIHDIRCLAMFQSIKIALFIIEIKATESQHAVHAAAHQSIYATRPFQNDTCYNYT